MIEEATDLDSTLVRRGNSAATFREMEAFVETIEGRPLDKLLADLPGLAELSPTKFSLARQIIRRRARGLDRVDREQLQVIAFEIADDAGAGVGERIRSLFSFA